MRRARDRSGGVFAALAAVAVVASSAAATPPKFLQRRFGRITAGASVSATFKRANRAGNLIVAHVVWDNAGAVTLTDSRGNRYVGAAGPTQAAGDPGSSQVFYARDVGAGTNTVTAAFATPTTTRGVLFVAEYSGLDTAAPLDATVSAAGSGPTMDSGPLATSTAGELLFAGGFVNAKSARKFTKGFHARFRRYGTLSGDLAAATAGAYDLTAQQKGTAWALNLVAFKPPGPTPPVPGLLLGVSPSGRYLVDQHGAPFLIQGDSPQALIVNLSEAEADAFFADRQAAGFDLVWVNLLCATYTGGRADGSTYDGIVPFTTADDLSTPNEAYFARVDRMLNSAAQHGLVVLLDPAETGSFLAVLNANGATKARNYGRYLGTRYRSFDNIVWMHGNDFQTWQNAGDDAVVQAVARGIHDTDDRHVHTVELDYQVSGSLDDPTWAPLIELNASYTYFPTYAQVLTDYDRPNALPTFLVESNYEFEHNAADLGTPQILRRQAYWALLSGAAGHLYGNRYTWPFVDGWQDNLDTPGSAQMGFVRFLFAGRRWFDLVPDQTHAVVTSGYGTYADGGTMIDNDYLTAARTPDGALVLAYMPTVRAITVDMSQLGAPANAQWYDPSNGTYTAIAGSPLPNTGTRGFTPPGPNAAGDGDWALVLEATSTAPDTTPPSVPTGLAATTVSSSEIALTWNASTDDVGVAGYRVYRNGAFVRTTAATSMTDTGLAPSTAYSYTVSAYDFANHESAQSAPVVGTTAGPGPTFVQVAFATPQASQASVGATYAGDQTAGNTIILAIGWNDTSASIASVTDGAGNAYQPAVATFRGNGMSQAIWYAPDIHAAAGGTNTVTVTFTQAAVFVDLRITEYAGLRTTSPFDAGVSATGVGASAATGSVATASPGELLFAAGMTGTSFSAPGAGYTTRVVTTPDGDLVEDAVAASAGSSAAGASLGSGTWVLQLAAFRAP